MSFWEGFLKEVEEGMIWPLVNSSQWCGGGMGSLGEAGPRLIRTWVNEAPLGWGYADHQTRPLVPWDPQGWIISTGLWQLLPASHSALSQHIGFLLYFNLLGHPCFLVPSVGWNGFQTCSERVWVTCTGLTPMASGLQAHSSILCSVLWGWTLQTTLPRPLCISLPKRGAGGRWTRRAGEGEEKLFSGI